MEIIEALGGSNLARNGFVSGRDINVFDHIQIFCCLLILCTRTFNFRKLNTQLKKYFHKYCAIA